MKRPFKDLSDGKLLSEYHELGYIIYDLDVFGNSEIVKLIYLELEMKERG